MFRILSTTALLVLLTTPVLAQEISTDEAAAAPSFWDGWSVTLGAATDNRSKAVSKSGGDPYVYGVAEWASDDGFFYAGPGVEAIQSNGADAEVQAFAGIRPEVAGFDLDLKAAFKQQIGATAGADDNAFEFTANLSRSIGPAKARLQLQHSPDGTGATEAWTWVEARVGWDFTDRLTGTAAIGRREQDNSVDYTGWNAGVSYAVARHLDVDLRYYDTDANSPAEQYQSAVVAGFSVYF